MYEKIESFSCQTSIEGEKYVYKYFLLQSIKKVSMENDEIDVQCYGIEIQRERIIADRVVDTYSENIKYMSPQKNKVLGLLNLLKDYEVSPIHLVDVTGDSVDEWVEDFDYVTSNNQKRALFV